jgi:transposase
MWCVPEINEEYKKRMEDILRLYKRKFDPKRPIICFDEKPVQLLEDFSYYESNSPQLKKKDCKYRRKGTANIFSISEPKAGKYYHYTTKNRKGKEFAKVIKRITMKYPNAKTIHLVLDNLSTHSLRSLERFYSEKEAAEIWGRLTLHFTPKGASWLNQAEIVIGLLSRQCLGKTRIPTISELKDKVNAWTKAVNKKQLVIKWGFSVADARKVFQYDD